MGSVVDGFRVYEPGLNDDVQKGKGHTPEELEYAKTERAIPDSSRWQK